MKAGFEKWQNDETSRENDNSGILPNHFNGSSVSLVKSYLRDSLTGDFPALILSPSRLSPGGEWSISVATVTMAEGNGHTDKTMDGLLFPTVLLIGWGRWEL